MMKLFEGHDNYKGHDSKGVVVRPFSSGSMTCKNPNHASTIFARTRVVVLLVVLYSIVMYSLVQPCTGAVQPGTGLYNLSRGLYMGCTAFRWVSSRHHGA